MDKKYFIVNKIILFFLSICIVFGYSNVASSTQVISLVGKYDSADTAVIKSVDTSEKTITFRNHQTGKDYTLSYDNTSLIYDKYGRAISAALLDECSIVDVTFLSGSKHINSIVVNDSAFEIEKSSGYDLDYDDDSAKIGDSRYIINDKVLVMIDGRSARIADILQKDTIKISGIGKEIYSIEVLNGHGYVSLSSSMVAGRSINGAYLEIGSKIIHRISDNMLINVPVGTYNAVILGKGVDFETTITVERDTETVIDTSQIEVIVDTGLVTFELIPEDATLYIDGAVVDTSEPIELEYGTYHIEAKADGYEDVSEYLHVGSSSATVEITMTESEEDDEDEDDSTKDDSAEDTSADDDLSTRADSNEDTDENEDDDEDDVSENTMTKTTSSAVTATTNSSSSASTSTSEVEDGTVIDGYFVYIDAPTDAELYLDGVYIGMIPTNFEKVTGSHTITLRKSGYITKSYTIKLDSKKSDKTYSFPSLEKEEEEDDSSNDASTSKTTDEDVSENSTSSSSDTSSLSSSTEESNEDTKSSSDDSDAESSKKSSESASDDEDKDSSAASTTDSTSYSEKESSKSSDEDNDDTDKSDDKTLDKDDDDTKSKDTTDESSKEDSSKTGGSIE